jgi:hypothetical protein
MNKNAIIVVLLFLVVAMPGGYMFYRHHKIKQAHALTTTIPPAIKYKPKINVTNTDKGYILFTPSEGLPFFANGSLIIVDMQGRVYVNKHIDGTVFDFRQWHVGNKVWYTYAVSDTRAMHLKFTDDHSVPSHVVVLDSALNEIKQLNFIPHGGLTEEGSQHLDPHDLIILGEDHFITLANYEKRVNNIPDSLHPSPKLKVYTAIIQERVGDKVVWQWDASHFPELYASSVRSNKYNVDTFTQDYLHVNVMILDPKDSNLVISFRNTNQLIKVNRKDGSIMWRLGGKKSDFPLADNQKFYGQHAAVFADANTLLFVDNGSELRPYTRIVEMVLDEEHKTIASFKAYRVPHLYIPQQGNVSKLGDKYFICGGVARYLLLVDPTTDKYHFEMSGNLASYRAYVVDSIYGLERGEE